MSWTPMHFHASNKEVAEAALAEGILKYPGICYIHDGDYGGYTAWVTKEGTLDYIGGYNQITGIEYHDGKLYFMAGDQILYEANTTMTPETEQSIINEITENINLESYATKEEVSALLDSIIGNLGDSSNVVDYISHLSYNSLKDTPIQNVYGTLTAAVNISDLETGVYRVNGQFRIGGPYQTIQMGADGSLFVVAHLDEITYVTQVSGNEIRIYTINVDGTGSSDKYITEAYIKDKDFITSGEVIEYVKELVGEGVEEAVIEAINNELDKQLMAHFSSIADEDILALF